MKRIIFFLTHTTLTYEHADLCFKALGASVNPPIFNELIIYNTHSHELPNEEILKLYDKYDCTRFIDEVNIFDYPHNTPKNLASDIDCIRNWCLEHYEQTDRVLLLKSDILISSMYLYETTKTDLLPKVLFISAFYNSKRSISDEELYNFSRSDVVVRSSNEIFFIEDENNSKDNNTRDRGKFNLPCVKYLCCTGKRDWSCPYLTVNIFPHVITRILEWGGWDAEPVKEWWVGSYMSFTVHKWHGVLSENNPNDRSNDDYRNWLNS